MATTIGTFRPTPDGWSGRITTLSVQADVVIRPAGAPGLFTVYAGAAALGTARRHPAGKTATLPVELDDPSWTGPISADLVDVGHGDFQLIWKRDLQRVSGDLRVAGDVIAGVA